MDGLGREMFLATTIFILCGVIHSGTCQMTNDQKQMRCVECAWSSSGDRSGGACSDPYSATFDSSIKTAYCKHGCLKTIVEIDKVELDDAPPELQIARSCSPQKMAEGCRDPVTAKHQSIEMTTTTCFCSDSEKCNSASNVYFNVLLGTLCLLLTLSRVLN